MPAPPPAAPAGTVEHVLQIEPAEWALLKARIHPLVMFRFRAYKRETGKKSDAEAIRVLLCKGLTAEGF